MRLFVRYPVPRDCLCPPDTSLNSGDTKPQLRTENESFILVLWGEKCFGSVTFWVSLTDRANQEIGAPGKRFLPIKMGVSWEGGRLARLE